MTLSVVLEWDNAGHESESQTRQAVGSSLAQIAAEAPDAEVLLLHGEEDERPVKAMLERVRPPSLEVRVEAVPGLRYYQLKNEGARRTSGDPILFLDSDVVLAPGAMRALLDGLADPSIQVLTSAVSTGPWRTFYDRAFGLFWNFALPRRPGPPVRTHHFTANSVVFRRPVFEAHPFPDDRRLRGQCTSLAMTFRREGIPVHLAPTAVVWHPPPRPFGYMLRRGLWHGHDKYVAAAMRGDRTGASVAASFRHLGSFLELSARRVVRGRRQVGLSALEVVPAVGLAVAYYGASWAGFLLTKADPNLLRRRFPI